MGTELTTILAKVVKTSEKFNQIPFFSTNWKKFHTKHNVLVHFYFKTDPL